MVTTHFQIIIEFYHSVQGQQFFTTILTFNLKTAHPLHFRSIYLWLTDKRLEGELRADAEQIYGYSVFEKDHEFLEIEGQYFKKIKFGGKNFAPRREDFK